jgi:hypothetical protein
MRVWSLVLTCKIDYNINGAGAGHLGAVSICAVLIVGGVSQTRPILRASRRLFASVAKRSFSIASLVSRATSRGLGRCGFASGKPFVVRGL